MGGVGVVGANYLTSSFYNPALVAIYRRNDDAGMILPGFGVTYRDHDQLVDTIDDVSHLIDSVNAGDTSKNAELQAKLNALDGAQLKANIGGIVAIGIPNSYLSMNFFGNAYAETYVTPDVYTTGATTLENAQNSTIDAVSVGITEAGITIGKYGNFLGQHFTIGISPKIQRIYTYVYEASVKNYDISDITKNKEAENMFNIDVGLLWFYGPARIGISGMNLISKDIHTRTITSSVAGKGNLQYDYDFGPTYTLGAGLVYDYAQISIDYDLNEQERYIGFADNTQMFRIGAELDILRQLKLRAGYKKNLAYSNADGTYTGGIGLSPLGLFELDLAVEYTNQDSMGASVNFLATY